MTKKTSVLQKQIPTLLGVLVLVIGLGAGIFFFSDGLGVFAPRAAPESTPGTIKITNISDTGFSVSFLTTSATPGYIRYGTTPDDLNLRAGDDRDQLTGSIDTYTLHHISTRELEPDAEYFFKIGTVGSELFDNEGKAFSVRTSPRSGTPPTAKTIYGSVVTASGSPAEGSVVFVSIPGAAPLSSLVQSSGSWAIPLSRARNPEAGTIITTDDSTQVDITVQGVRANVTSTLTATVATGQPVATITLGQNAATTTAADTDLPTSSEPVADISSTSAQLTDNKLDTRLSDTVSDQLTNMASDSAEVATASAAIAENFIVDLSETTKEVVTTSQPLIIGAAAPQVTVTIQVNSDTQINDQLIANADGSFEIDISKYEAELEPGEHSVTYSYVDPTTGQTVTKTKNFTVAPRSTAATTTDTSTEIALANTTGTSTTTSKAASTASTSGSAKAATTSATKTATSSTQKTTKATPFSSSNPVQIGGTSSSSAYPISTSSATRSAMVATNSALPKSGSVGTTAALAIAGMFFLFAGSWSLWASREWVRERSA